MRPRGSSHGESQRGQRAHDASNAVSGLTCSGAGVNISCVDTYVNGSDQITRADGTTLSGGAIYIDQSSYHCNRRSCFFDSDRFGFGNGTVSVSTKLTSASASGTISMTLCDRNGCTDDGTSDVSASWTGNGDLVKQSSNFKYTDGTFTFSDRFKGTFRNADASATVDGANPGDLDFADIFNVTDRQVSICHGC